MKRKLALVLASVFVLSACGSSTAGGDTTCSEWLALDLPASEALELALSGKDGNSDEQRDILRDALKESGKSNSSSNITFGRTNIIQYCGADGTGNRPNANQPISNALQ